MKQYKVIRYKLEKGEANLAIEKIGNISIILTGKGGVSMLDDYYKDVVKVIDYFDPKNGNEEVNPVIPSGYRLSSYIYHVYTNDTIYKIIPMYRKINLVD